MRRLFSCLIVVLTIFLYSAQAYAVGMGLYSSVGRGSADWDAPGSFYSGYQKFSTDTDHTSFGLALDTHLGGDDHLFNYHVSLGYDTFTMQDFLIVPYNYGLTPTTVTQTDLKMRGFVWTHAFGFGGEITPHTRLWLGPELRFTWAKGKPAEGVDVDMFGVGFGPTIGFNMNFRRFSLVIKTGYQFMRYDADVKGYLNSTTSVDRNYDVDEKLMYVNLEFFVRSLGDR